MTEVTTEISNSPTHVTKTKITGNLCCSRQKRVMNVEVVLKVDNTFTGEVLWALNHSLVKITKVGACPVMDLQNYNTWLMETI